VRATVVVDTQNAYGSAGDALGLRAKPTPAGVVDAFGSVGFEVDEVRIAVALPDLQDAQRARSELRGLEKGLQQLSVEIAAVALPPSVQLAALSFRQHADAAAVQCVDMSSNAVSVRDRLTDLNSDAMSVIADHEPASEKLRSLIHELSEEARRSKGPVPADWVTTMRTLVEASRRVSVIRAAVEAISSFAYAGGENLDYHASLPPSVGTASVVVLEGRFRPGRDGTTPGEKQVDTLCAVACVEARPQP